MPAINMAGDVVVPANPSTGAAVLMSPFSGPKGSPFDAKSYHPTTRVLGADPTNFSTGGLSTGIGFGMNRVTVFNIFTPGTPGFEDDETPGISMPGSTAGAPINAIKAILIAIGGGKTTLVDGTGPNGNGTPAGTQYPNTDPYNVQPLLGFGNGGSRDAGAGPAFTGFGTKMVTATATVANGAAIEAGFLNRSGVSMTSGQSAFGSATAASAAVT